MSDAEKLAAELLQPTPAILNTTTVVTPKPQRRSLPRHQGLWASVSLEELSDQRYHSLMPARLRLLLFLRIRTRRGSRAFRLTNEAAAEIGLDRKWKWKCLRSLETDGFITVEQAGQRVPVITLCAVNPAPDRLPTDDTEDVDGAQETTNCLPVGDAAVVSEATDRRLNDDTG
jgi:hypothetical protein